MQVWDALNRLSEKSAQGNDDDCSKETDGNSSSNNNDNDDRSLNLMPVGSAQIAHSLYPDTAKERMTMAEDNVVKLLRLFHREGRAEALDARTVRELENAAAAAAAAVTNVDSDDGNDDIDVDSSGGGDKRKRKRGRIAKMRAAALAKSIVRIPPPYRSVLSYLSLCLLCLLFFFSHLFSPCTLRHDDTIIL